MTDTNALTALAEADFSPYSAEAVSWLDIIEIRILVNYLYLDILELLTEHRLYYTDGFSYVEPSLHICGEAYLIMMDDSSDV
ncbi:hypothetical protein H671_8g19571 [Cricetulus griseus]|uniref:Uncharacterized protein n=1 Tax=Cricetulus griseus TaxID=10029 RepID=A0A061HVK9_CRIGR|nr:hypothetical protein H671_8g19571 [Cricetulus griseus]